MATPSFVPVTPNEGDPNASDFSKNKGEIVLCRQCKNADPNCPPSLHTNCKWCLSSGYVAICLPCNGTGKVVALAAWDGKSQHGSTCNACGGNGTIPARKREYERWQLDHPAPTPLVDAPEVEADASK